MNIKSQKDFRLVVDFSEKTVSRLRFRERDRNGKYVPIERPWGAEELGGLKLVARVTNATSRGVADLDEACRTASAPRRRKLGKKRLAEDAGAPQTSRTGTGYNGPDKGDDV